MKMRVDQAVTLGAIRCWAYRERSALLSPPRLMAQLSGSTRFDALEFRLAGKMRLPEDKYGRRIADTRLKNLHKLLRNGAFQFFVERIAHLDQDVSFFPHIGRSVDPIAE